MRYLLIKRDEGNYRLLECMIITVQSGRYSASYSKHKPKLVGGLSLALPEYTQEDGYSCGFCAALTVARYFDPTVEDEAVFEAVHSTNRKYTPQKVVIDGLALLGINARYRDDLVVESLRLYVSLGVPVIITVWPDSYPMDHWTVVRGFSLDGEVHCTNHSVMSADEFVHQWIEAWEGWDTGAGLICTKQHGG